MRVLVTGGTGFTGSHVSRRFLDRGDRVRILDNRRGLVFDELSARGAEMMQGSITDSAVVRRAVEGIDLVLHLAAVFRDVNASLAFHRTVNVEATRMLGRESLRAGVRRFVYCSTEGVHGHVENPPCDEDGPIAPADVYQLTKWEGELAVRQLEADGLPVVIVRPTGIYGPGDPGRFLLLFRAVRRGHFFIVGDGTAPYHPVYVDNLVDGFELAADEPRALGGVFLIGDERAIAWNDLVPLVGRVSGVAVRVHHLPLWPVWVASAACEAVCRPLGVRPPLYRRRAEMFTQVRSFDLSRARSVLGYVPRVGLEEGLRRTREWYLANGYL